MAVRIPGEMRPSLNDDVDSIETPALVVDLDAMERNIDEYAAFADEHDVALRSHVKTHKIPDIAHRQHAKTGDGIICQTLGEAEVMAQAGLDDIYLSYMVVETSKLDRLVRLSERVDSFVTTVDGPGNVDPVQTAASKHDAIVDVVLEIDIGLNRVGVEPGDRAVELARYVNERPNLRLTGVMAYEGHIGYGSNGAKTAEEYERRCTAAMDDVEETVDLIEAAGIPIEDVKVGSTATSRYSGTHSVVTEINPGMYLFNDVNLLECAPHVDREDCALTVLSTVISRPTEDRVVVDAGSKSISLDIDRMPMPKARDDVVYVNASEEHGWIDTTDCAERIEVGDRLAFVPPHVCTTINLHDTVVGVRDGRVAEVWSVQARGKVA